MFRVYDRRGHGLLREWCKWIGTSFRVKVNCCVRIPTWRSPFLALLLAPAAALVQGWALPPVVYSFTLRGLMCSYLKWQKGEEGEANCSHGSPYLSWSRPFPDPPLPGSSPSPLRSAVSSCWPPGLMGLLASCLTSHINLPSLLQISADQISHFQDSGHKAPFSGIISN